ncbi:MAG: beta-ketoacyl-ACP synthase 3, partial [Hyphomonadaceae bacterium]|nr:beta-ketoacyl-ACP synthase 3 [Clostridia bacterium]
MTINIVGTGSHVPETIVTNDDLAKFIDTSDEWIRERTGILERRIAQGNCLLDLVTQASQKAMLDAGVTGEEIDLIIVASITGDTLVPSTAGALQAKIGANKAIAFDINAACSGFIYAIAIASNMMQNSGLKKALIIGAEQLSKITNWEDRSTCVLFGDAAGAAVLSSGDEGGILAYALKNQPDTDGVLTCKGLSNQYPACKEENNQMTLQMQGPNVFRFATMVMVEMILKVLAEANLTADDIAWIVPHQANKRIIDYAAKK